MTLDGQPILSGTVSSGQITDERASRKFSMTTDPAAGSTPTCSTGCDSTAFAPFSHNHFGESWIGPASTGLTVTTTAPPQAWSLGSWDGKAPGSVSLLGRRLASGAIRKRVLAFLARRPAPTKTPFWDGTHPPMASEVVSSDTLHPVPDAAWWEVQTRPTAQPSASMARFNRPLARACLVRNSPPTGAEWASTVKRCQRLASGFAGWQQRPVARPSVSTATQIHRMALAFTASTTLALGQRRAWKGRLTRLPAPPWACLAA